jgi:hypothetical protein
MPAAGFEPTITASERPQTYALDRAATGMGSLVQQAVGNGRWMALVQDRVHISYSVNSAESSEFC